MSKIAITDVQAFLYRESRLLDDEEWDEWLTWTHRSGCRRGMTKTSSSPIRSVKFR